MTKLYEDGDGKELTSTPVQFRHEAWEYKQTDCLKDSGLNDVPEISRNWILKTLGKFRSPEKGPPLSPKEMRVKCT